MWVVSFECLKTKPIRVCLHDVSFPSPLASSPALPLPSASAAVNVGLPLITASVMPGEPACWVWDIAQPQTGSAQRAKAGRRRWVRPGRARGGDGVRGEGSQRHSVRGSGSNRRAGESAVTPYGNAVNGAMRKWGAPAVEHTRFGLYGEFSERSGLLRVVGDRCITSSCSDIRHNMLCRTPNCGNPRNIRNLFRTWACEACWTQMMSGFWWDNFFRSGWNEVFILSIVLAYSPHYYIHGTHGMVLICNCQFNTAEVNVKMCSRFVLIFRGFKGNTQLRCPTSKANSFVANRLAITFFFCVLST